DHVGRPAPCAGGPGRRTGGAGHVATVNARVGFLCPVPGCGRALTFEPHGLGCRRGHAFDAARSGYINLLQPPDRPAPRPGDDAATVAARGRLAARGFEAPITDAISGLVPAGPEEAVLDVGCGGGHHLAAMVARSGTEGHGIDISVAAIAAAARKYPGCHWIVANADRFLPYADGSFHVVTSITARRNPGEFRRVVRDDGVLLLVVPAPDDLIE